MYTFLKKARHLYDTVAVWRMAVSLDFNATVPLRLSESPVVHVTKGDSLYFSVITQGIEARWKDPLWCPVYAYDGDESWEFEMRNCLFKSPLHRWGSSHTWQYFFLIIKLSLFSPSSHLGFVDEDERYLGCHISLMVFNLCFRSFYCTDFFYFLLFFLIPTYFHSFPANPSSRRNQANSAKQIQRKQY